MILKKKFISVTWLCLMTFSVNAGLFSGSVNETFGDFRNEITNGGASFEWGIPASGIDKNNRFTFTGFGFSNVMENTTFAIGDFNYQYGTTYNSIGSNNVKLEIEKMLIDPLIESAIFDYNFSIANTPNTANGSVIGGHIITNSSTISPEMSTYPGSDLSLNLLGLSTGGGTTIRTDFSTPEGTGKSAQFFTSCVTAEPANVPEPGILSLFILGFSSMGTLTLLRRRN